MKKGNRISRTFRYVLSAAVAVVLLYFSFREVKWGDFIDGLRSCRWEFILLSMAASIVAFWLRGLRWREILLPLDRSITRLTTFNAINIGYIANFVFPRIGEFVRCGFITRNSEPEDADGKVKAPDTAGLHEGPDNVRDASGDVLGMSSGPEEGYGQEADFRKKKASYDKVLGTVVLERSWDMVSMLVLLLVLLVFKWQDFGSFFVDKMWHPIQETLDFSIWWVVAGFLVSILLLIWIVVGTKDRFALTRKISGICEGLCQGVGSCMKMEKKWKFFLYTLLIWMMYWVMSAATMWALPDLDALGPVDALFLMVAGSLGWLVPVPGGFGAFHFIVSLALSTIYGIPFELGIVFATLSHESQAITMAVCGGVSYLYETLKK